MSSKRTFWSDPIGEKRCGRTVAQVKAVLLYRDGLPPIHMHAMADGPNATGQFFFNGTTVFFHKDDEKYRKFIVYDSVEQLQRTVGKSTKVRLQP